MDDNLTLHERYDKLVFIVKFEKRSHGCSDTTNGDKVVPFGAGKTAHSNKGLVTPSPDSGGSPEGLVSPPESNLIRRVQELFPEYVDGDERYEQYLSEVNLEQFSHYRGLGLDVADVAYQIELNAMLLESMMEGIGINLDTFVRLASKELAAMAHLKVKHLNVIETAGELNKDWKASQAFLDRVFPATEKNAGKQPEDKQNWNINVMPGKGVEAAEEEEAAREKAEADTAKELKKA